MFSNLLDVRTVEKEKYQRSLHFVYFGISIDYYKLTKGEGLGHLNSEI